MSGAGNGKKKILVVLILVTLAAGVSATQIETGFNFESFMPEDSPAVKVYEKMQTNFPFTIKEIGKSIISTYVLSPLELSEEALKKEGEEIE